MEGSGSQYTEPIFALPRWCPDQGPWQETRCGERESVACRAPWPQLAALQLDPAVLTGPQSFIISPEATIPIVPVVGSFGGDLSHHFLPSQAAFQSAAGWGQRAENSDTLWQGTAGDGRTSDTLLHFYFHSSRLKAASNLLDLTAHKPMKLILILSLGGQLFFFFFFHFMKDEHSIWLFSFL